jgi:hypothetical protein
VVLLFYVERGCILDLGVGQVGDPVHGLGCAGLKGGGVIKFESVSGISRRQTTMVLFLALLEHEELV